MDKALTLHKIEDLIRQNALIVGDGYRAKNSELSKFGLPFARGGNINNGFRFDNAECLDFSNVERAGEKVSQKNDVVFTSKGTVGRFAFVQESTPKFVYSPQLCYWRVKDESLIEPRFLFYWMQGREFFVQFNGVKGQTDMADYVSLTDQRRMKITLPPREEQKVIANILNSLDDKIELTKEMNWTLEATAQAFFTAWFVDFEPVKANSENRLSESASEDVAALFPNEFEKSELGSIPRGWQVKELTEVFEVNPARKLSKGQNAKYLDMANVPTVGHCVANFVEREFSSGTKFTQGDTLLARITPCLENGKTAFVDFLNDKETGWGSTEFIVLRPKNGLPNYFAYLLSRQSDFRAFAIQSMTGTSGRQRVQVDSLGRYKIAVPPETSPINKLFAEVTDPLVEQITHNSTKTRVVKSLRNLLLPKLISGEIRVPVD